MLRVGVIGYGNPLRRDDAAGGRVAEVVAQRWGKRVAVLMGQQPVPEWAGADVTFVVDASLRDGRRLRVRRLLPETSSEPGRCAHQFGPQYLLWLCRRRFTGSATVTYLLPLPAESLEIGQGLSPRTAAEQAVRILNRRLAALTFARP
jgi:hydrogenase maturation protease